jgi:hypothetical protein
VVAAFVVACRAAVLSERTIEFYLEALDSYRAFAGAHERDLTLADVELGVARAWLADFVERGRKPATVAARARALRVFSHWIVTDEYIRTDPLGKLKVPSIPRTIVETFTTAAGEGEPAARTGSQVSEESGSVDRDGRPHPGMDQALEAVNTRAKWRALEFVARCHARRTKDPGDGALRDGRQTEKGIDLVDAATAEGGHLGECMELAAQVVGVDRSVLGEADALRSIPPGRCLTRCE